MGADRKDVRTACFEQGGDVIGMVILAIGILIGRPLAHGDAIDAELELVRRGNVCSRPHDRLVWKIDGFPESAVVVLVARLTPDPRSPLPIAIL